MIVGCAVALFVVGVLAIGAVLIVGHGMALVLACRDLFLGIGDHVELTWIVLQSGGVLLLFCWVLYGCRRDRRLREARRDLLAVLASRRERLRRVV